MGTQRKLIDASVLIGLLNTKDKHHKKCVDFINKVSAANFTDSGVALVIPIHTFIEVNTKIRKLKNAGIWEGIRPFVSQGVEFYSLTRDLLEKIERANLYDVLGKLGSQDAIYAAIAFLENIPLITLDKDFEKVKDIIKVEFI